MQQVIGRHRRHVEESPGVGADRQQYALSVLDDVEPDVLAVLAAERTAREQDRQVAESFFAAAREGERMLRERMEQAEQERDRLRAEVKRVIAVLPEPVWNDRRVLVWSLLDVERLRAALVPQDTPRQEPTE
jgi:hypothetical protein